MTHRELSLERLLLEEKGAVHCSLRLDRELPFLGIAWVEYSGLGLFVLRYDPLHTHGAREILERCPLEVEISKEAPTLHRGRRLGSNSGKTRS
jgi:hypothetical protein